jgi:hypothetical protein
MKRPASFHAKRTCRCRRRGCTAARERWQLVCLQCWDEVPALMRNHLSKLRRLGLTRIVRRTEQHILQHLGRKPADQANGPAAKAARTYARTAAMLGERVD